MGEIFNFDEKLGVFKANLRDVPPWVREGMSLFETMTPENRELMVKFVFTMIKADVATGLAGEEAGSFFEEIDELYAKVEADDVKIQNTCFFCDDGADTGLCMWHLMKILGLNTVEEVQAYFSQNVKKRGKKHEH